MIVTLTCENDSTTHEVLYVDKDFEFGAIQWSYRDWEIGRAHV